MVIEATVNVKRELITRMSKLRKWRAQIRPKLTTQTDIQRHYTPPIKIKIDGK